MQAYVRGFFKMDFFVFASGPLAHSKEVIVHDTSTGFARLFQADLGLPKPLICDHSPNGAVCVVAREAGQIETSIAVAESPAHFILFYGEADGLDLPQIARRLDTAPAQDVLSDLAGGDGCFGCLVYAKTSGVVRLFGDMAGQRTLRWTRCADGSLIVASHDVALIATGALRPVPDPTSFASAGAIGWSLGDASHITGISVCRPGDLVTLHPARNLAGCDGDRVDRLEPVMKGDAPIADLAVASLERSLGHRQHVTAELSAGFDSRASLAALLALRQPHQITAFCEGPETSQDVLTAQRICQRTGIRLEHRMTPALSEENGDVFVQAWSRATVECNGNFSTRVLASWMAFDDLLLSGMSVGGDGGEIFRDVYRPYRPYGSFVGTPERPAEDVLARRFLPGPHDPAVMHRLRAVTARLRAGARSEAQVLRRFYVTERFGVWNQKLARASGRRARISPFHGRHAMRAVDGCDRMAAEGGRLHHALVARYLPAALDLPVNGEASMKRHTGRSIDRFVLETRILGGKLGRRLARSPAGRIVDLEDARSAVATRMSARAIAASESGLLVEGTRFRGTVEEIEAQIARNGSDAWTELAAERFARICENVYHAVAMERRWRLSA